MIKTFKVRNFYSIKDEQTISFAITPKDHKDDSSFKTPLGNLLNNTVAILGHNASGKTNLLKALSFCVWFVKNSYTLIADGKSPIVGVFPHKLAEDNLSCFELTFENDGREFQYKIHLSGEMVHYEFLGEKKQRGYSAVYEIKRTKNLDSFVKFNLPPLTKGDKERFAIRKNISLFSFLQNTGHLPKFGLPYLVRCDSNLGIFGRDESDSSRLFLNLRMAFDTNSNRREKIIKLIKKLDCGITDFVDKEDYIVFTHRENPTDIRRVKNIFFKHATNNAEFELDFFNESNGTQRILCLLARIFDALEKGKLLVWDEIDASIHPLVVREIIKLFSNSDYNKTHAQIIFSTHAPLLLNDRNKTQIFLIERGEKLASEVYRLDEVEGIRNDDNFCNKYLAGSYGAIGNIRRI